MTRLFLFIAAILAASTFSFWLGRDYSARSIATACYLDNGFVADGIAFWCGDINDYAEAGK